MPRHCTFLPLDDGGLPHHCTLLLQGDGGVLRHCTLLLWGGGAASPRYNLLPSGGGAALSARSPLLSDDGAALSARSPLLSDDGVGLPRHSLLPSGGGAALPDHSFLLWGGGAVSPRSHFLSDLPHAKQSDNRLCCPGNHDARYHSLPRKNYGHPHKKATCIPPARGSAALPPVVPALYIFPRSSDPVLPDLPDSFSPFVFLLHDPLPFYCTYFFLEIQGDRLLLKDSLRNSPWCCVRLRSTLIAT